MQALGSVAYEYGVPPRALAALAERYTAEGLRCLERTRLAHEQAVAQADAELQRLGALCIRLQCIALPIHAWVAVVNMFCAGLGFAGKAFLLATARQGTCFLPILFPMAYFMGELGIVSVQAVADVLTLVLAVPIIRRVLRQVHQAQLNTGTPMPE